MNFAGEKQGMHYSVSPERDAFRVDGEEGNAGVVFKIGTFGEFYVVA